MGKSTINGHFPLLYWETHPPMPGSLGRFHPYGPAIRPTWRAPSRSCKTWCRSSCRGFRRRYANSGGTVALSPHDMGLSENRGYPQIAILMGNHWNMVIIHWNMRYTIFRQTHMITVICIYNDIHVCITMINSVSCIYTVYILYWNYVYTDGLLTGLLTRRTPLVTYWTKPTSPTANDLAPAILYEHR